MNDKIRVVRLYGALGTMFGRVHKLAVETPREALKALSVTLHGFEPFLNTSRQRGLTYAVFSGTRNIGSEELQCDNGNEDIRIAPVIIGSKQAGLFQTIFGAVLIASAFALSFTPLAAASPYVYMMGASMALGGVIQMLSPQPKGLASKQDPDNRASYAFGGVTNTAAQGYPVALCYGKPRIGGAIISAGIYVEDQQ